MRYLFMMKSLTYAQKAQKALESAGIFSNIIKTPSSLTTKGCGYSVSVGISRGKKAAEVLRNAKLPGKAYIQKSDGSYEEVLR